MMAGDKSHPAQSLHVPGWAPRIPNVSLISEEWSQKEEAEKQVHGETIKAAG